MKQGRVRKEMGLMPLLLMTFVYHILLVPCNKVLLPEIANRLYYVEQNTS